MYVSNPVDCMEHKNKRGAWKMPLFFCASSYCYCSLICLFVPIFFPHFFPPYFVMKLLMQKLCLFFKVLILGPNVTHLNWLALEGPLTIINKPTRFLTAYSGISVEEKARQYIFLLNIIRLAFSYGMACTERVVVFFTLEGEWVFLAQLHQLPRCVYTKKVLETSRNSSNTCSMEGNFIWPVHGKMH